MDVKNCQNDDSFFVFEEILYEVMLYWLRDEWFADKIDKPYQLLSSKIVSMEPSVYMYRFLQGSNQREFHPGN